MKKDFAIAKQPGATDPTARPAEVLLPAPEAVTVRKTIEVPDSLFWMVKKTALARRMKEKDVWAEILQEYFQNHPID